MGFLDPWNDGASLISGRSSRRRHSSRSRHHKKSRSRSRSSDSSSRKRKSGSRSHAGSIFGGDRYDKHNASRSSFFGLGGNGNNSRSSFFGLNKSSYYKRSPRPGFIQRSYKQLKRLLRDLVHWAKRHPWKVFFLVIMPLITGGALTALLARFGLRIPRSIERLLGVASRAAGGGSSMGLVGEAVRMATDFGGSGGAKVERGQTDDYEWERRTSYATSGGGARGGGGWSDNLVDMAKKFI